MGWLWKLFNDDRVSEVMLSFYYKEPDGWTNEQLVMVAFSMLRKKDFDNFFDLSNSLIDKNPLNIGGLYFAKGQFYDLLGKHEMAMKSYYLSSLNYNPFGLKYYIRKKITEDNNWSIDKDTKEISDLVDEWVLSEKVPVVTGAMFEASKLQDANIRFLTLNRLYSLLDRRDDLGECGKMRITYDQIQKALKETMKPKSLGNCKGQRKETYIHTLTHPAKMGKKQKGLE